MDQYPTIRLVVARGDIIAVVIALLPLAGAVAVAALFKVHWLVLVAGAVASLVSYFLMRSFVEIVRIIADMLLPK